MNLLEKFMKAIDYRITNGDKFLWHCFGGNAYCIDHWDGSHSGFSASIIFDTATQQTYSLSVYDYQRNRAYRWIHPDYRNQHHDEASERMPGIERQAWDDVDFIEIDLESDFFSKLAAIVSGVDYDERISVTLDLDDELALALMMEAHRQDITLNQLVRNVLNKVSANVE